ncbi:SGNH/GDSL hydrolase family protein [Azospirillum picis]|uniref:Lysophospholipase L1-like esterase n=1 Tax=Azospirillum picis TaxID=488438 RepID=A0ABU0MFH0_9PROT|nr:SGNH/GDSL hydrolase family protein [Azospirillum picis]MBP2298772.1 lysophospholipase L1-like esterase [Azospirillum picis]MDQ0532179.1 lysophospholipase L1-like esterase [Azospirillum picis]
MSHDLPAFPRSSIRTVALIAALAVSACFAGAARALETGSPVQCQGPRTDAALSAPLPNLSQRIAAGGPIRIVAIGSSSTAGAGASASDRAYPARLAHYLRQRFRMTDIEVLNRGINGETDDQTERRIDPDALASKPDLVIWQVGANTVLRDGDQGLSERSVRQGVKRLRAAGIDVVLMDLQYAPKMLEKTGAAPMLARIADIASDEHVGLYRRFAAMRSLVESRRVTLADLIGPDGVHQNDLGYDCVASILAVGLEDAVRLHDSSLGR